MRPHRRQFLIGPETAKFGDDWSSLSLGPGCHLSYQTDLTIERATIQGREVTILGQSYPLAQASASTPGTPEFLHNRAGRFVLIDWPMLYLDASGLLGVYYCRREGGLALSSSVALLRMKYGLTVSARQLKWRGISWFPPPRSRLLEANKLIVDQAMNLSTGEISWNRRELRTDASLRERAEMLGRGVRDAIDEAARKHARIVLAMTGGLDSRTLFAVLVESGARFEAITQRFPGMSRSDVQIARELCGAYGIKHTIVDLEPPSEVLSREWEDHTLNSYSEADNAYLFPGNAYRFLQPGDVLIRGGCFEIGRRFFGDHFASLRPSKVTGSTICAALGGVLRRNEGADGFAEGVDEWLLWRRAHDNGLDLVDSFYLDQRLGGWLSSIEQALDMLDGVSLQPANSGVVFSALVGSEASGRDVQKALIGALDGRLLSFPINPTPLTKRIRRRIGMIARAVLALRS